MERKNSSYIDTKGVMLSDGDKAQIEYYEKGRWTDYNTVKIIVKEDDRC